MPLFHLREDRSLALGIDEAVGGPVPVEDVLQPPEHPFVAPGVGGEKGDGHRILGHLFQEVKDVPGRVSFQADLFFPLPEPGGGGLVETSEVVQVVGPMPLFEKVVRLLILQDLEEHHDRGGFALHVAQVGVKPGEFLLSDLQAEGLPGQAGPQG